MERYSLRGSEERRTRESITSAGYSDSGKGGFGTIIIKTNESPRNRGQGQRKVNKPCGSANTKPASFKKRGERLNWSDVTA